MMMMVEWELMGRDKGKMAGDVTLKIYFYTLALASLWKAVSHLRHDSGGGALAVSCRTSGLINSIQFN
jgi:hypothetical protein